jgi:tripartite-type tricarboxylate transporter receptor subunit TctC
MKLPARIVAATAAATIVCAGFIAGAGAQAPAPAFPAKPMRLIVSVQPGGNLDLMGRAVAQSLTASLGQPVIVENRPGANTIIGTAFVAKSAPDGYTLLMVAPSFVVAPVMQSAPYHPLRDFTGVSHIATLPQMIVVHPSLPARSVRELIALAKARPDELICVTSGNGSGSHLAMELFKRQAGVRLMRIAYNGDAQAMIQLLGGQVPLKFDNLSTSIPHVNAGRLRALGVTSPQRTPLLPGVPAIAETLPGYESSIFNGMAVPAATPKEIVARIQGEIAKFAQSPENRARFAQQGVELIGSTPEQFNSLVKAEYGRLSTLIKEAGITQE